MGSSASKNEETNEIKAVQEMDETELSSKVVKTKCLRKRL